MSLWTNTRELARACRIPSRLTGMASIQNRRTGSSVSGATISPHEAQGTDTQQRFMADHLLYIHPEKQGKEEGEMERNCGLERHS